MASPDLLIDITFSRVYILYIAQDMANNIVVISPETRYMTEQWRQLLTSHIIPDIVHSGKMEDEQTLKTINPHAKIRINMYNTPAKVGK